MKTSKACYHALMEPKSTPRLKDMNRHAFLISISLYCHFSHGQSYIRPILHYAISCHPFVYKSPRLLFVVVFKKLTSYSRTILPFWTHTLAVCTSFVTDSGSPCQKLRNGGSLRFRRRVSTIWLAVWEYCGRGFHCFQSPPCTSPFSSFVCLELSKIYVEEDFVSLSLSSNRDGGLVELWEVGILSS